MYRLLLYLVTLLLPMTLHAQKEDFLPPKLNKKVQQVQKTQPKKNKTKAPAVIRRQNSKENKSVPEPRKRPDNNQHIIPQDTMPTPGFIKYIPRASNLSFNDSEMSDYQVEVLAVHDYSAAQFLETELYEYKVKVVHLSC